jgi:hypothetical protein
VMGPGVKKVECRARRRYLRERRAFGPGRLAAGQI